MRLSEKLWRAHSDFATACLQHPFVQGIGDGSLPTACFAHYVGQDAFFLETFARAYSIAAAKAPSWEQLKELHQLASGVLSERQLHEGYAVEWGIALGATQASAATQRYTDFLIATAWSQEMGLTAVAMAPCMRLYAFLGQELVRNGLPEHRYASWIRTYSSPDFEHLAQQLEQIVNQHASESPRVASTYRYAMRCEYDFFQSAWETHQGAGTAHQARP